MQKVSIEGPQFYKTGCGFEAAHGLRT